MLNRRWRAHTPGDPLHSCGVKASDGCEIVHSEHRSRTLNCMHSVTNWCRLMIDRAVLRELAAMLLERTEDPNRVVNDRDSILPPDEVEETPERPARRWYEALLSRRNAQ